MTYKLNNYYHSFLSFIGKNSKKIVLIFFAVIFAAGSLLSLDYGINYDATSESNILMTNIKHIGQALFGEDFGEQDYLRNLPSMDNFKERDHGKAMYYPFAVFRLIVHPGSQATQQALHLYTFVINFAGLIFLYLSAKFLFRRRFFGILSVALFLANPRIFADLFYNDKDMVFASLVIASIYFSLKIISEPKIGTAVLLGIFTAFATNARILGLFFPALALLLYIIVMSKNKNWNLKSILIIVVSLLTSFAVFILITPATWSGIVDYFKYTIGFSANFSRWNGSVLYFGEIYTHRANPLPWHYLPVMIFMTTPVIITLSFLTGVFTSLKNFKEKNWKYFLILIIFILFPIIFAIINKSNIYNGWRHFYFLYPLMVLFAVYGIKFLFERKTKFLKYISYSLVFFQILASFTWICINHPYEYIFYNAVSKGISRECEVDYWNVSAADCLIECAKKDGGKFTISSPELHSNEGLISATELLPDDLRENINILDIENFESADYILINPMYIKITEMRNPDFNFNLDSYSLFNEIRADGKVLIQIYKRNGA